MLQMFLSLHKASVKSKFAMPHWAELEMHHRAELPGNESIELPKWGRWTCGAVAA